jgi:hypothetical protein
MKSSLIAPCGMNCGICYAYLRKKNHCPGCRSFYADEPVSIARCKIRNCEFIKSGVIKFCFKCNDFPCKILKRLDKRYRTKYHMSEIANLEFIRKYGIKKFIEEEKIKWTCGKCGGAICAHTGACFICGAGLKKTR